MRRPKLVLPVLSTSPAQPFSGAVQAAGRGQGSPLLLDELLPLLVLLEELLVEPPLPLLEELEDWPPPAPPPLPPPPLLPQPVTGAAAASASRSPPPIKIGFFIVRSRG
jgi:hypothetical protein